MSFDLSGVASDGRRDARGVWWRRLPWLVLAIPGLAQLWLLLATVFSRYAYPYDLEWMEGGMLVHAQRVADGVGIYVEPSVYFIPYLYTPLYPGLLASFGSIFGLSYQLGRAISILSLLAVLALATVAILREARRRPGDRELLWLGGCGAALAAGFFAATYPWVEGWYDLVRADTLFLAMILGGLTGLRRWAREGRGWSGQLRVAAVAAILGLSFFCKQTGVLFVAAGGAALLVMNWRRVPIYVATAGVIGLGGTWLLDRTSGGWFWTYAYEVHQVHDFNMDRFYQSFENILYKFPLMTGVILVALILVCITAATRRQLSIPAGGFLYWTFIFAVSCLVGALGWGTQWAHFNAYIPAMTTGAIAAGAALPAIAACAASLAPSGARWPVPIAMVPAAALGWQLVTAWWQPAAFVPHPDDRAAGDKLIEYIRSIEGEVWVPYHPWYSHLAGKIPYVHRMGIMDVTYANGWQVRHLETALTDARFAAVILDNRAPGAEFRGLHRGYRLDDHLPHDMAPRLYSGARVIPQQVWKPARPEPTPRGATVLFDFEDGSFSGWAREGRAWGNAPVTRPVPKQGPVRRYGGRYFITSMHGGDAATGTLRSPTFSLDGDRLTFRISGGKDPERLRVELHIAGAAVRSATAETNSERMYDVEWNVAEFRGEEAQLVFVDESPDSWGHLNADEFLLHAN